MYNDVKTGDIPILSQGNRLLHDCREHLCSDQKGVRRKEDSINRLTDPFDNSICEKWANVKKAFVVNIAPAVFPQVENGQQSQDYFL